MCKAGSGEREMSSQCSTVMLDSVSMYKCADTYICKNIKDWNEFYTLLGSILCRHFICCRMIFFFHFKYSSKQKNVNYFYLCRYLLTQLKASCLMDYLFIIYRRLLWSFIWYSKGDLLFCLCKKNDLQIIRKSSFGADR